MISKGDLVIHRKHPLKRRVLDINEKGEILIWGFYTYISKENVKVVEKNGCS